MGCAYRVAHAASPPPFDEAEGLSRAVRWRCQRLRAIVPGALVSLACPQSTAWQSTPRRGAVDSATARPRSGRILSLKDSVRRRRRAGSASSRPRSVVRAIGLDHLARDRNPLGLVCFPLAIQCDRSAVGTRRMAVPRVARRLAALARARPTAIASTAPRSRTNALPAVPD